MPAGPDRITVFGVAVDLFCDDLNTACIRLMANRATLTLWALAAEQIIRVKHIDSIEAAVKLAADRLLESGDLPLA